MAISVRQDLADHLTAEITGVTVYNYPPDNLKSPAIAIQPSDPYLEPFTQSGPDAVLAGLDLTCIVSRSKVDEGLTALEALFEELIAALLTFPGAELASWADFGDIGGLTVAGVEYLSGALSTGIVIKLN